MLNNISMQRDLPGANEIGWLLKDKGFREFKPLGVGKDAFVFSTTEDQIVRVTNQETRNEGKFLKVIKDSPYVIQPINTYDIGEYKAEILPEMTLLGDVIKKGDISKKDAEKKYNKFKI